jgi:ketosteroid isomerase-like protein
VSEENVEIVKRAIDAFNRQHVDAFANLVTPDFEWFPSMVSVVEGGSFRGREGIESYFHESRSTWEGLLVIGDDFRDLGDQVLMTGRTEGRGRGSGVPTDARLDVVWDLRDGKIALVRAYLDHDQALKAVGLI